MSYSLRVRSRRAGAFVSMVLVCQSMATVIAIGVRTSGARTQVSVQRYACFRPSQTSRPA